jgi:hypothetical protein
VYTRYDEAGGVLDLGEISGSMAVLRVGSADSDLDYLLDWGFFSYFGPVEAKKGKRSLRLCSPKIATCADG